MASRFLFAKSLLTAAAGCAALLATTAHADPRGHRGGHDDHHHHANNKPRVSISINSRPYYRPRYAAAPVIFYQPTPYPVVSYHRPYPYYSAPYFRPVFFTSAAYRAFEYSRPFAQVVVNDPGSNMDYTLTPGNPTRADDGRYCREYQTSVYVGGQHQKGYGQACRQPDGAWEVVS